jgi:hypothetical protein
MDDVEPIVLKLTYEEAKALQILLVSVMAIVSKVDKPLTNKPYIESIFHQLTYLLEQ